jgi:uncharacterized membrane protein YqjE
MTDTNGASPVGSPGRADDLRVEHGTRSRAGAPADQSAHAAAGATAARAAGLRRGLFGPPPQKGAAEAVKAVAEDASALVKAEINLAKAEVMGAVKEKATGGGLLAAAGALLAVAGLGLLLTLGFVLAEVAGLPGWASALIVSVLLILGAAVLGFAGKKKLETDISVDTTKRNVEEDVEWTKRHLTGR